VTKKKQVSPETSALICLCLALLVVLLWRYGGVVCGARNFYLGDNTLYFEPLCRYIGNAFAHGRLPLWNSLSYCGMPQIAIPSPGIFNPFSLLFAIMPFSSALAVQLIAHQIICAAGMFFLILLTGAGLFPALIGGAIAALSGYMFSLHSNYTLVLTASWIPFVCAFLLRINGKRSRGNALNIIGAAISTAMTLLSGRPEIFAPFMVLLTLSLALLAYAKKEWKVFLCRVSTLACGTCLAAPMLLPLLEWSHLCPRAAGLNAAEAFTWSANWYDFLSIMLPQPLGDLSGSASHFSAIASSHPGAVPYVGSTYLGIVPLILAVYAFMTRPLKVRIIAIVSMILVVSLTMGNNSFLAPLLVHIPGLNMLRYPIKLMCLPLLKIAFFAAIGAEVVLSGNLNSQTQRIAVAISAAITFCGLILIMLPDQVTSAFYGMSSQNLSFGIESIGSHLLGAGLSASVFCAITHLFSSKKMADRAYKAGLLTFVALPLALQALISPAHLTDANYYRAESGVAKELKSYAGGNFFRGLATYIVLRSAPADYVYGNGSDPIASFHAFNRDLLVPNTHMDALIPSSFGYESAETGAYRKLFLDGTELFDSASILTAGATRPQTNADKELAFSRFCRMTATEFVLTQTQAVGAAGTYNVSALNKEYFDLLRTDSARNLRIYRTKNACPRAYFARHCANGADATQVASLLGTLWQNKNRDFPASDTLIEGLPQETEDFDPSGSTCTVSGEADERLVCAVNAHTNGMLIVTDQNYPGWHAYLDDKAVPILTANYLQRAVRIPAGKHKLEMRYEPVSLYLGGALWALAVVALGGLTGLCWRVKD